MKKKKRKKENFRSIARQNQSQTFGGELKSAKSRQRSTSPTVLYASLPCKGTKGLN
jgi:hypothetical protein